jgi:hypothetical protein
MYRLQIIMVLLLLCRTRRKPEQSFDQERRVYTGSQNVVDVDMVFPKHSLHLTPAGLSPRQDFNRPYRKRLRSTEMWSSGVQG